MYDGGRSSTCLRRPTSRESGGILPLTAPVRGREDNRPAAQIQYLGMNSTVYEPFEEPAGAGGAVPFHRPRGHHSRGIYEGAALLLLTGQVTGPGVAGYNPDFPAMPYDP